MFASACLSLHATTYYVTIAGLGGEPEYEQRFSGLAKDIDHLLRPAADAKVETLYGPDATKAKFDNVMASFAREAKADDALVVMMIGHGSFDGVDYKINLPGPDLTAVELASLLDRIPTKRQLVAVMTSCSGASRAVLEKPDRTIITATKTGTEKNATVFARFWVEAMRESSADTDKNDIISALEAFRYAEDKTTKYYDAAKRLATEHPMLEDTGKGDGVNNPSSENGEGLVAGRFALVRIGAAQQIAADPAKKALLAHKEQLEQQIDELKYKKATIPPELYKQQISTLLLDLAKTQAELDK
ncbi:MAG TPA: hypothetical protein VKU01_16140 [Bryobacteraceae bacterium]|nr:hypothetical protein [Bryobacteraceae bacterium]